MEWEGVGEVGVGVGDGKQPRRMGGLVWPGSGEVLWFVWTTRIDAIQSDTWSIRRHSRGTYCSGCAVRCSSKKYWIGLDSEHIVASPPQCLVRH